MAAAHVDVLDGIEREISTRATKGSKAAKTVKPRVGNKLSSGSRTEGINADPGRARQGSPEPQPSTSTAEPQTAKAMPMAATQADITQLQTTVNALTEQMRWFVDQVTQDEGDEASEGDDPPPEQPDTLPLDGGNVVPPPEDGRVLDGLERFYNATDNVAADIDEQLAKIVGNLCQNTLSEDKFKDKMAAYVRPANCPALAVTKVNPLIWDKLSSATRSADIKTQRVQNTNMQAMIAVTTAASALVTASRSDEKLSDQVMASTITALVDALALMANADQTLDQRRRDGQRPDLSQGYKALCAGDATSTGSGFLYGDDLPARIKAIGDANRISSKLVNAPFGQRPPTHARFGNRQQPYATRPKPGWAGRFRSAFLERGALPNYRGRAQAKRGFGRQSTRPATRNKDAM